MSTKVLSAFDAIVNLGLNTFHKAVGLLFTVALIASLLTAFIVILGYSLLK